MDLLREINAPALVEQVIAVPKISLDRVPQRSVCRRSRRAEQLVEVPTIVSYYSLQQRTAKQTIDLPVPHGRGDRGGGEGSARYAQDRIQHRLWSRTLTFQFLMVVVDGSGMEAFKVSPRDRLLQRFVEQIMLTLQFLRVVAALEVLKASSRVLLALHPRTRLVPWMRLLLGFFALFPKSEKVRGWTLIHGLRRLMWAPWCSRTSWGWSRSRSQSRRRTSRLALQLAFGLCGSVRGSWSSTWVGPCGGVPTATGAPSHTHGLSFTRKLQPMSMNSPRTFLSEAVVAASGPGRRWEQGREAARCSFAEDREDGRGRPCLFNDKFPQS